MVGCLKASVVLVVLLVKFHAVPPHLLLIIPFFYIGVAVYALMNRVYKAAYLCFLILAVMAIVNIVPSPARDAFHRLWNQ